MKKLFIILGLFPISVLLPDAEGKYVAPASVDKKGTLEWYSYFKGYVLEQIEGKLFSQRELAFKYGVKWVPMRNLELYIEPPLIRYHHGKAPGARSYDMGLGDMDIRAKTIFAKGIGASAFIRVPSGNAEMPLWDNWCPKFSNNKWGGGAKFIFSQELIEEVDVHLNLGVLFNIGDLVTEDNPIPEKRVPLGLSVTLPYGAFIEVETDINSYTEDITIAANPKRITAGTNYELGQGIKFLAALEYGTWGTGDPPIHKWSHGYTREGDHQWDITLGISYMPIKKPPRKPEAVAMEELKERDKKIAELEERLAKQKEENAKLNGEILLLQSQLEESKAKLKYEYEVHKVTTGDCLWKIAGQVYGEGNNYLWLLIYHVNKERIKNPNRIYPGQELRILKLPEREEK